MSHEVTTEDQQFIGEFIYHYILNNFESTGQMESLDMEQAIQFHGHPWVLECRGEYECFGKDSPDISPEYGVQTWIENVSIHSVKKIETIQFDANEIQTIINEIGQ